jgi:uncharacterized protein (TIGR02147 family)
MDNLVTDRIYEYDNYRSFLRDYFVEQKRLRDVFSHRFFARRAGFASSSFCSHVIDGKRNLTSESLRKMIRGMRLTGKSASYFEALVQFNQAKTVEDRETWFRELERLRKSTSFYRVNQQQFAYYDEWYYPVIRELVAHGDWRGDYRLLGSMVTPAITPDKARRAVQTLESIGMIQRGVDTFIQTNQAVTARDVPSAVTRKTRKEFLLRAIEAMETLPVDQRHVSGVTVSMSEKTYREVMDRLDEMRREILEMAINDESSERVYQINVQAFPLSERMGKRMPNGGREEMK